MEIKFNSLQVLAQFATAAECCELIAESREIVPFCLDGCRNARSQPNRYTDNFKFQTAGYAADHFLQLLLSLCAASSLVCSEFVRLRGLAEVTAALQLDPNGGASEGVEVRRAVDILWRFCEPKTVCTSLLFVQRKTFSQVLTVFFIPFSPIQKDSLCSFLNYYLSF